jgi:hypothetical protein
MAVFFILAAVRTSNPTHTLIRYAIIRNNVLPQIVFEATDWLRELHLFRCTCSIMTYSRYGPYGEFFLKQGRPDFPFKGCVILCTTTYEVKVSGEKLCKRILAGSFPKLLSSSHAEKLILD